MSSADARSGFSLARAIAALRTAGLLDTVFLPGGAGLVAHEPAAAAALGRASFLGARLDSRELQTGELFVALPGQRTHGRRFAGDWLAAGGWVLTDRAQRPDPLLGAPGPATAGVLVCADPAAALGVLAEEWRRSLSTEVVAVTGTNGKTTTKDFLAAMLAGAGPTHATAGNYNNALGVPLTLLGLRAAHRYAVIEMGASAGGEIDYLAGLAQPRVGVITNAAPAHLAEFGSLAAIIRGKGELLDHLPADGAAVLNADSPGWSEWRDRAPCRVVSLGGAGGDHRWSHRVGDAGGELDLDGAPWPVPLPGAHNAANLAAAILAARALAVDESALRQGLDAFAGSAHRGVVLTIAGRIILDDSYNANPASVVAATRTLCGMADRAQGARTFAVLGTMAELGDDSDAIHRRTGRDLAATGVAHLVAVGAPARPLCEGFDAAAGGAHYCATLADAANWLGAATRPGDRVLVKGSRSAAMEELLPLLTAVLGGDQELPD